MPSNSFCTAERVITASQKALTAPVAPPQIKVSSRQHPVIHSNTTTTTITT